MTEPLLEQLLVEREGYAFYVSLEFDRLPAFCTSCHCIGHVTSSCNVQQSVGAAAKKQQTAATATKGVAAGATNKIEATNNPSNGRAEAAGVEAGRLMNQALNIADQLQEKIVDDNAKIKNLRVHGKEGAGLHVIAPVGPNLDEAFSTPIIDSTAAIVAANHATPAAPFEIHEVVLALPDSATAKALNNAAAATTLNVTTAVPTPGNIAADPVIALRVAVPAPHPLKGADPAAAVQTNAAVAQLNAAAETTNQNAVATLDAYPETSTLKASAADDPEAATDSQQDDNSFEGMPPLEDLSNDQNQLSSEDISSVAAEAVAGAIDVTAKIHMPASSISHKKWDFAAIVDAASKSEPEHVDLLPHVPKTKPKVPYTCDVESDNLLNKVADFYRKDWVDFPPQVQHDMALLEAVGYD
uniref:Uncharacterized protein n=1 Tax=Cajanus cajan TaxID=3821 RepID=A0A151SWR7_CAJCA|nr:hypothetical protein KK1_014660 [Cajanus cajan]